MQTEQFADFGPLLSPARPVGESLELGGGVRWRPGRASALFSSSAQRGKHHGERAPRLALPALLIRGDRGDGQGACGHRAPSYTCAVVVMNQFVSMQRVSNRFRVALFKGSLFLFFKLPISNKPGWRNWQTRQT